MDNDALNDVLNTSGKQFWLKPWGHPERSPDEEQQSFDSHSITIGFTEQPSGVNVGDILIVHRIKVSKLIFVAETVASPVKSTEEQIKANPDYGRWLWNIDTRILTPTYGAQWDRFSLKTFSLAKEYSDLYPQDKVNLGRIQFGGDKLRISEGFAKFLIKEIMRLA
jgi:hypothetical protein